MNPEDTKSQLSSATYRSATFGFLFYMKRKVNSAVMTWKRNLVVIYRAKGYSGY